jgi:hypothetical protein
MTPTTTLFTSNTEDILDGIPPNERFSSVAPTDGAESKARITHKSVITATSNINFLSRVDVEFVVLIGDY